MNLSVLDLDAKISSIIDYLYEHQRPDGEFRMLRSFRRQVGDYVGPTGYEGWYDFGRCSFATATIIYHLHGIAHPKVAEMIEKGCRFLQRGIENGVVRYVPAYDRPVDLPADVDCTCVTMAALSRAGHKAPGNVSMILSNTDGRGNFYSWLVPRSRHLRNPVNFCWLIRDFEMCRRRMRSYGTDENQLRRMNKEYYESSEPAVAANALLFLGIHAGTEGYLKALIQHIEKDNMPLQYYDTPSAACFHVARLHAAGAGQLGCLTDKIVSGITRRQKPDGEVEGPFNTAMAALTMIYFGCWGSEPLNKAVRYVAFNEMHEQGWLPFPYCNDLHGVFDDGAPELTAAFYLEVLIRCRQYISSGTSLSFGQSPLHVSSVIGPDREKNP